MAKRIAKGNIGEEFVIEREDGHRMNCYLVDFKGEGDWAQATFTDPYFPDGRWGKWVATRYRSRWETNSGKRIRSI